jgi:lipoate-protein ligase A
LIVPSQTANAPKFYAASLEMEQWGWPVYVRDTGGDVTPQSPGIINASAAFVVPRTKDLSIRATYERFCAPLLAFLRTFGLDAYLSSVERSFCDGAFNIAVDGKKLAGTAQRWRLTHTSDGEPGVAVLAHAAILDNPDIDLSISATNSFYGLCGMPRQVDPAQHTSLAKLIEPTHAGAETYADRLSAFLDHQR